MNKIELYNGDCREHLINLEDNSIDSVVTDPPYLIEFMQKSWDRGQISFDTELYKRLFEVLKPGGHMLVFGGTRTYDLMVGAVRRAGFEIRDTITWIYGSGFPKSLDISKAIDKMNSKKSEEFKELGDYIKSQRVRLGISTKEITELFPSKTGGLTGCLWNWENATNVPTMEQWQILKDRLELDDGFDYIIEREEAEREIIGKDGRTAKESIFNLGIQEEWDLTLPSTSEAQTWDGWGTGLKPAVEFILVSRKPISEKNISLNVLKHGTGGLNVDDCRIGEFENITPSGLQRFREWSDRHTGQNRPIKPSLLNLSKGRFPSNLILDPESAKLLDEQSGERKTGGGNKRNTQPNLFRSQIKHREQHPDYSDEKGGASRFFYVAKASSSERYFICRVCDIVDNNRRKHLKHSMRCLECGIDYEPDGEIGMEGVNSPLNLAFQEIYTPPPNSKITHRDHNTESNLIGHPTQKPVKLIEYLIKLVTRENQIVLDPFVGSGTTSVACIRLRRDSIGIDNEPDYIRIAQTRIEKEPLYHLKPLESWS